MVDIFQYREPARYTAVSIPLLYLSLAMWIAALALLSLVVIRRARGVPIEATKIA